MNEITEIIPDDIPQWARDAMESGQLWKTVFDKIKGLEKIVFHENEMTLDDWAKMLPQHYYVCQKALWVGNTTVDIDHIDNNLSNPLDYKKAFKRMVEKLIET